MYNPKSFKSTDEEDAFLFMYQFPFATLISVDSELNPVISHLPLMTQKTHTEVQLIGHLAKANPHWKELRGGS